MSSGASAAIETGDTVPTSGGLSLRELESLTDSHPTAVPSLQRAAADPGRGWSCTRTTPGYRVSLKRQVGANGGMGALWMDLSDGTSVRLQTLFPTRNPDELGGRAFAFAARYAPEGILSRVLILNRKSRVLYQVSSVLREITPVNREPLCRVTRNGS